MNTMQVLKKLFDFQKFERNPKLVQMIKDAEGDAAALPDAALSLVSAAGEIDPAQLPKAPKNV